LIGHGAPTALSAEQYADIAVAIMAPFKEMAGVWWQPANEPHDADTPTMMSVYNVMFARLRAAGINNAVLLCGNYYSNARGWTTYGDRGGTNAALALTIRDPIRNYRWDLHQYVDDAGGTVPPGAKLFDAVDVLNAAATWARAHGQKLILGEFGCGLEAGAAGRSEIGLLVDYVEANPDVFDGWIAYAVLAGEPTFSHPKPEPYANYFLGMDPVANRRDPISSQDFSGKTPEDARITFLKRYTQPRAAFSLEGELIPKNALLCHLPAYFGRTGARWTDTSGKGNHFVQATVANQPAIDANGGMRFAAGKTLTCRTLPTISPNRITFNGSINGDVLTLVDDAVAEAGAVAAIIGCALGTSSDRVMPAMTWIKQHLTGRLGAAGSTYRLSHRFNNPVGARAMIAADGVSKHFVLATVHHDAAAVTDANRTLLGTNRNGLELRLVSDGTVSFNNAGVSALGGAGDRPRAGDERSRPTRLIGLLCGVNGLGSLAMIDGSPVGWAFNYGHSPGQFSGESGVAQIGPGAAGPGGTFSIRSLTIIDWTRIDSQTLMKVIGAEMRLWGLRSIQEGWIYDRHMPRE
jgi:hypothetical protein